jgi:hypothetical protein
MRMGYTFKRLHDFATAGMILGKLKLVESNVRGKPA